MTEQDSLEADNIDNAVRVGLYFAVIHIFSISRLRVSLTWAFDVRSHELLTTLVVTALGLLLVLANCVVTLSQCLSQQSKQR